MLAKPLLLPSNGFAGYDEIIDLYPFDLGFVLDSRNDFINLSFIEFIYWVLKNYTNVKNPKELYIFDASYIYFALYGFFISNEYEITNRCVHCYESNLIYIDLSSLEIKYLESQEHMIKEYHHAGMIFKIRPRKIKDSLKTGNIDLGLEEKRLIDRIFKYIFLQCEDIIFNGEQVLNEEELCDIIKYHSKDSLDSHLSFFEKIKALDCQYGFLGEKFQCINCGEINDIAIFDSFSSAIISPPQRDDTAYKTEYDYIKNFLATSSQKIMSFSEIKKIPMNRVNEYFEAITEIVKMKSGDDAKDYLSSGGLG